MQANESKKKRKKRKKRLNPQRRNKFLLKQRYKKEAKLQDIRDNFARITELSTSINNNWERMEELLENDTLNWEYIACAQDMHQQFQKISKIVSEKIEPLWKAEPRAPKNKYKGLRCFINATDERNDRYNKQSVQMHDDVKLYISIFP